MIGQRYHDKKTVVLDVCRRYLRLRGETEDGVDADFLKERMKALKDSRYVLAVVGEVKAGKSTFINALLGESILPTDVLQSSSAIVEIFKSKEKYVEVEYADGSVKKIEDDPDTPDLDEAVQHLRHIGAIQDRYRGIPTTMIDACIANDSIALDRLPIDDLETASGLWLRDKEALIRNYVETRKPSDIPQKVSFGFPLKYAFDGLRLVDSPGVNARGGVQDVTYGYVQEANALLFVHSLESAIESSSFSEFVTKVVPNRTLETLFLILTRSGMKSKIEIDEKVDEARQQYREKFNQDRILHVDSMLKIISEEIREFDSAASLKEHYREQKKHFEGKYSRDKGQWWGAEVVKFDTKLKLLNNVLDGVEDDSDRKAVRGALRELSNFDEMERIIDGISKRAPELQLAELLETVKKGYEGQNRDLDEKISALEKKKKSPQMFEGEISQIQDLLERYKNSMQTHTENVIRQFTGLQASYRKDLEEITINYKKKISQASSLDSGKKTLIDFHDEMGSLADEIGGQIKSEFESKMKQLGEEFKAKHDITVPTVDFLGIEAEAKRRAYHTVKVPRSPKGVWEWTLKVITFGNKEFYKGKREYSQGRHLSAYRSAACMAVSEKKDEFNELVRNFIANVTSAFRSALQQRINKRNDELEDIKTKKETNEGMLRNIAEAKQKKRDNAEGLSWVSDMLGDIA